MEDLKLSDIKQPALLIFSNTVCPACHELISNIEGIDFNVVVINEHNGGILGPEFAIIAAPTNILINNDLEVARFYGAKTKEYVENFLNDNIK